MTTTHRLARFHLAVIIALACSCTAIAQDSGFQDLRAIGENELDQMRGGFFSDTGLIVSIGIERSVLINGELVTSTLTIPDLQLFSGTGMGQATLTGPAFLLVQNGPGNTFTLAPNASAFGTVVQNTLDNQVIAGLTKINASVSNLGLVRSMDLTSSVGQMIGRSAR